MYHANIRSLIFILLLTQIELTRFMSNSSYSVTLSRAHKLVERTNSFIKDLPYYDIRDKLMETITTEEDLEEAKLNSPAARTRLSEYLDDMRKFEETLFKIKHAIILSNGSNGVHQLLFLIPRIKAELIQLKILLNDMKSWKRRPAIGKNDVELTKRLEISLKKKEYAKLVTSIVDIEDWYKQVENEIKSTQLRLMNLEDKIGEVNERTIVEFEIPSDVAERIGLSNQ